MPRPHPLPAALAPRTQRCLLPSAGTQICHLVSSARPQNPARHPHSFAPRRIALPAAFQVAVLRAGARVRLARRIWHAGALLNGDSPMLPVPWLEGTFFGIQTGTAVCRSSSTLPWHVPLSLIVPCMCPHAGRPAHASGCGQQVFVFRFLFFTNTKVQTQQYRLRCRQPRSSPRMDR